MSQQDFQSYFYDHHDAVVMLDREGSIVEVNHSAEELFGYSRDDLLGRKDIELLDLERIEPAIIEMIIRNVFSGEAHLADVWARKKNGESFQIEMLMNRVTFNGDDVLVLTVRDISMRKQVEAAMRESEDRYRSLVDLSPFAILIIVNEKITYLNPAAIRLLKADNPHEVIGKPLELYVHPDERRMLHTWLDHSRGGSRELEETRFMDVHHSQVDVQSICLPIYFKGMPATQIIGLDITENKQLEEQLRQAQKLEAIGMLAGGIAHDFNNILTGIIGFAGLGYSTLSPDHAAQGYFKNIEEKSQEAASLVHQLLAFSRKEILNFTELDVNHVIAGQADFLGRVLPEDIELVTVLSKAAGQIYADPTALQQIITNLTVNARDAMPDGGAITISTEVLQVEDDSPLLAKEIKPGHYVRMAVQDVGVGMTEDVLENIYNPFFTTKDIGQGSGLGLSMVYGLMKQHNGYITCNSQIGQGTSFELYFPYSDRGKVVGTERVEAELVRGGRETILVAEDDVDVLTILQGILESSGYKVIMAKNGKVALNILEKEADGIDLVITDLVMPEMSGIELYNQVEYLPNCPSFLFISGYARSSEVQKAKFDGEMDFLRKPFTSAQMNRKIREILDRPKPE